MTDFNVKITFPDSGEIVELKIEGIDEHDARSKFFRRKQFSDIIAHRPGAKFIVEIKEDLGEVQLEYRREELIEICEKAIVPQSMWHDRDSYGAQRGVAEAWMLLRAGVKFQIIKAPEDKTDEAPMLATDHKTIWIRFIEIEGFQYHELGEEGWEEATHYLPTLRRLEEKNGDWY